MCTVITLNQLSPKVHWKTYRTPALIWCEIQKKQASETKACSSNSK